MAIGSVIQRGVYAYIYDEKGRQIANIAIGSGKDCSLMGYTAGTVSIKRGNRIYIYNEKGQQVGNTSA
jgi:hypothetical protein